MTLSAGIAGFVFFELFDPALGQFGLVANDFPQVLVAALAADVAHCVVQRRAGGRCGGADPAGVSGHRFPEHHGAVGAPVPRLRLVRHLARRALVGGGGRAGGGPPAAPAACGRPVGLRPVRRGTARLRQHRARTDGRGGDQGLLHPRPQRAGVDRVGAHCPRHRHARGPGRLAAVRGHAARHRQARRPDPTAAEVGWPDRGGVRGDPAAPGAGRRDRVARSASSTRRTTASCTTTSASTAAATPRAWSGTRSPSSPG